MQRAPDFGLGDAVLELQEDDGAQVGQGFVHDDAGEAAHAQDPLQVMQE